MFLSRITVLFNAADFTTAGRQIHNCLFIIIICQGCVNLLRTKRDELSSQHVKNVYQLKNDKYNVIVISCLTLDPQNPLGCEISNHSVILKFA